MSAVSLIKTVIRKTLPKKMGRKLIVLCKPTYYRLSDTLKRGYYLLVHWQHNYTVRKLQKKERLKVAFFLIHDSVWKYDGIYKLMEFSEHFDPIIVVCPYTMYGEEEMLKCMKDAYNLFSSRGYNVVRSYNETTKKWLNVKKEIKPDIVFFANPHNLTKKEYYIHHYPDCLTCYVPYNYGNSHLYQMMHNQSFHNLLWRLFAETPIHKEFSVKYALNKGINVTVTGFPGTDVFLDPSYIPQNRWKQKDENIKKIIWAPHHSIDNDKTFLSYSSFLMYADYMVKIAREFNGKIQIAFKPHPLLIKKLYNEPGWGKEAADRYYDQWDAMENGQFVNGDYVDLFLTSDAMIHDSGSFLIEYLYTGKPVLHTVRDEHITDRMNEFGVKAFNQHYHAKKEEDIKGFIEALLKDQDVKKQSREAFLQKELLPPHHKSASENIYDELMKQLF